MSQGFGWRIHYGVEVTELSTKKQHLSLEIEKARARACDTALRFVSLWSCQTLH